MPSLGVTADPSPEPHTPISLYDTIVNLLILRMEHGPRSGLLPGRVILSARAKRCRRSAEDAGSLLRQVGELLEQLRATMNAELAEHVLQVGLDRLVADAEPFANLLVGHAVDQRVEDLAFPPGQRAGQVLRSPSRQPRFDE